MRKTRKTLILFLAVWGTAAMVWPLLQRYVVYAGPWKYYDRLVEFDEIESFGFLPGRKGEVDAKIWLEGGGFIHFGHSSYSASLDKPDLTFLHQFGEYDLKCSYHDDNSGSWPTIYGLSVLWGEEGQIALDDLITNYTKYEKIFSDWPRRGNDPIEFSISVEAHRKFRPYEEEEFKAKCWAEPVPKFPHTMFPPGNGRYGKDFIFFRDQISIF